jgi:hypothetical protein
MKLNLRAFKSTEVSHTRLDPIFFERIRIGINDICTTCKATKTNGRLPQLMGELYEFFVRFEKETGVSQLDYLVEVSIRSGKDVWV